MEDLQCALDDLPKRSSPPIFAGFARKPGQTFDSTGRVILETKQYEYTVYHGGAQIGMVVVAGAILLVSALVTGLILAICGLDMAWLQMKGSTGTAKQREQVDVISRMKRHGTWMLCSLVICDVACGEYFPFIIQSILGAEGTWLTFLISTLCIAIVGELLPQYIIPRNAIKWGYYCSPFIWLCMMATAVVSYPVAFILDYSSVKRGEHESMFTNAQLATLIKYHERSENNGGKLSRDATRIMLGALNMESRNICHVPKIQESISWGTEDDIEKAGTIMANSMIIKWDTVKTVNINDSIDEELIKKIKGWSHSRIPVIGKPLHPEYCEQAASDAIWVDTQIFGYLHIKNIIGLDLEGNSKFFTQDRPLVRDLLLYPLPIVKEDISVYELLNLLQHGMSKYVLCNLGDGNVRKNVLMAPRMAVVVPAPRINSTILAEQLADKIPSLSPLRPLVWSASQTLNAEAVLNSKENEENTNDYLEAALTNADNHGHRLQSIIGIRSSKPIGIVTLEDIVSTILQKRSRHEKEFFNRHFSTPLRKQKRDRDFPPRTDTSGIQDRTIEIDNVIIQTSQHSMLRKRKGLLNEKTVQTMDGADEKSLDTTCSDRIEAQKIRRDCFSSSYTQNSCGGFHREASSASADPRGLIFTISDIVEPGKLPSFDALVNLYLSMETQRAQETTEKVDWSRRSRTLPSRKTLSDKVINSLRRASDIPPLPQTQQLCRASPFTNIYSHERMNGKDFIVPISSTPDRSKTGESHRPCVAIGNMVKELRHKDNSETTTISSWCSEKVKNNSWSIYDSSFIQPREGCNGNKTDSSPLSVTDEPKEKAYSGFPLELLERQNKRNRIPEHMSSTLPRIPIREIGFYDDRALLPSQQRALYGNSRSTSFWI